MLETNFRGGGIRKLLCSIDTTCELFLAERGRSEVQCLVKRPKMAKLKKLFQRVFFSHLSA